LSGGRATKGTHYLAIAVAARGKGLRDAVAAVTGPDARVVRGAAGVTAVYALVEPFDARAEGERVRAGVASELGDPHTTAGVAGPKHGTSGAHYAVVQAEHALALGRALHGEGRTTHWDELGPYCFVLNQPVDEIRAFAERILGPLVTDDTHAELVDTLEAYLRTHGNLNAVARQLYLHRNTVRYRLHRIAKLTGADLDNPDTRLALQLAILGQRALRAAS